MTQQRMIQLDNGTWMTYQAYWELFKNMPFLECSGCLKTNVKFEGHVGDENYDFLLRLHNRRLENIGESPRCDCMEDVD